MAATQAIALNRFGLGARPDDAVGSDPRGWVLDQLGRFDPAPAPLSSQPTRADLILDLGDYRQSHARARQAMRDQGAGTRPDDAAAMRRELRQQYVTAADARVATAVQSDTPFVERLVHFWSNHFAVSVDKQDVRLLAGNYEFEAIRPHVLGTFGDLLNAAVTHPAMMLYLDQAKSVGPGSRFAQRRARAAKGREVGLNENLAREILELHTLGVRTGYSQSDVTEFARALTGWTVAGMGRGGAAQLPPARGQAGDSLFVEMLHEPGARTVMGRHYAEGGAEQAQAVLADLAASPATARHIATKLARHFIADDPPAAAIDRIERAFLASDGDLPATYRALVDSPDSWSDAQAKFRTPWDWTVAALRATGTSGMPNRQSAAAILLQLGQPIWRPGSPAGWGDTAADWASPGALLSRVELAQLIAGRIGDRLDARRLSKAVLADALTAETETAVARSEQPALGLAVMLASPEFMRR